MYIPNQELSVCLLQIWKADIVDDRDAPNLADVHRQWNVALSNSTVPSERANWLITRSDDVSGTGTLLISYPDEDEFGHPVIYQVDVMLNSKSGVKLASLQPGVVSKKVSVDYGVQYLYHHYWYSDPNSTSGSIQDIGWAETPEVVINEYHQQAILEIPAFTSDVGKYGSITVINQNSHVINVYADDLLIEDISLVEGSSQGLSSIPANSQTTFKVPVDSYTISCKQIGGGVQDAFNNISIVQDENVLLYSGVSYNNIQIVNNTSTVLGLFTIDEEYLGLIIQDNKTSPAFAIPDSYDTLLVMDFARTVCTGISYQSVVTINTLGNYLYNRVEMDTPWPNTDKVYQSPAIADDEETYMETTLYCEENVVLTFEYNVSSELNYDKFSFFTDGIVQLSNASGETGWVSFSKSFVPGTYSLIWKYEKDQSREEGRDNIQIRNISVD